MNYLPVVFAQHAWNIEAEEPHLIAIRKEILFLQAKTTWTITGIVTQRWPLLIRIGET